MPQRDLLLPWLRAIDNASLALRNRGERRERRARATRRRSSTASASRASRTPSRASSRAGCASASPSSARCSPTSRCSLLDEPFAGLDAITRGEMQEWLVAALAAEPRTVILVTHDVEEALYLCDRVAVLSARPARLVDRARRAAPAGRCRAPRRSRRPSSRAARERALRALREGSR